MSTSADMRVNGGRGPGPRQFQQPAGTRRGENEMEEVRPREGISGEAQVQKTSIRITSYVHEEEYMKKLGILFFLLALVVGLGTIGPAQAEPADLTVFDNQQHQTIFNYNVLSNPGKIAPPNTYSSTPNDEDQTLTLKVATGQIWDMEAAVRNNSDLVLIGGWNWAQSSGSEASKNLLATGHLLLQITNDPTTAKFGHFNTSPSTNNSNDIFKYDIAVKFDFSANTYSYVFLGKNSDTTFKLVNDVYSGWSAGDEAQYSNPIFLNKNNGSDPVWSAGGSLTNVKETGNPDLEKFGLTLYGEGSGKNNDHWILTLTNFYINVPGMANFDGLFGHIAESCGNDTLTFFDADPSKGVPLPGAVLLLGAGLARLAAYARRQRHQA